MARGLPLLEAELEAGRPFLPAHHEADGAGVPPETPPSSTDTPLRFPDHFGWHL